MTYIHKHHIIPKHEWKRRFGSLDGIDSQDKVWRITTPMNMVMTTQNIAEFCRTNNLKSSGISWAYHKNKTYMGYRVTREAR